MALHQLSLYAVESPPFLLHYRGTTPPPSTGPHFLPVSPRFHTISTNLKPSRIHLRRRSTPVFVGTENNADVGVPVEPTPEDLEYVAQIKRVLELLKQNRDMLFGEVKLTLMIEDLREAERKRLLGIDDNEVTREDLVDALEDVNEGRIPEDRLALRLLAEEMLQWPNLEVEAKKSKRSKSLYAKATDTGVDLQVAAKRLNIDWDTAAEIDSEDNDDDEVEVPPVVGYSALYLVSAFPVIIGISVVLILFYNSLQ